MRKIIKKIICTVLAAALIFSSVSGFSVCASDNTSGTDIPLIYIIGSGEEIYVRDEDGTERTLFPFNLSVDSFLDVAKDNIDVFAKALITGDWTEFGDLVRDTLSEYYDELKLDENGKAPNGSTCRWTYTKEQLKGKKVNGKYPTHSFQFIYDWRMDPYEIADSLHKYIEDVLEVTGEKQVAVMGRCLGSCIAAAYMDKYDCEYVSDLIIYASALKGATIVSKVFSGDFYLDPDGIERFAYDLDLSIEQNVKEMLQAFVTVYNATYGLDIACWNVNNYWKYIYLDIMPRVLIDNVGTWPGYWSMVSDEDYIRAKDTVFHDADKENWESFIRIIDNYHYNVQVKAEENFRKYAEKGVVVYNITKYGYQDIPISAPADEISDSYCSVKNASIGATTASISSTFSDDYVSGNQNGYISPDKQIDAYTCLFPARTWFIKNLEHKSFPDAVDPLLNEMVNTHGMTIRTDNRFPQYMVFSDGKILPMNEENNNTTQRYEHSFWESLKIFIRDLIAMIKIKINKTNG